MYYVNTVFLSFAQARHVEYYVGLQPRSYESFLHNGGQSEKKNTRMNIRVENLIILE